MEVETLVDKILNASFSSKTATEEDSQLFKFVNNDASALTLLDTSSLSDVLARLDSSIQERVDATIKKLTSDSCKLDTGIHGAQSRELGLQLETADKRSAALDKLWVIGCGLKEVQTCMEVEEFSAASSTLASMGLKISEFSQHVSKPTRLVEMLFESSQELAAKLKGRLEHAWTTAIVISETNESIVLETYEPEAIAKLFEQITNLDGANADLTDLRRAIYNKVVSPVLNAQVGEVEPINDGTKQRLILHLSTDSSGELGPRLHNLEETIDFLNRVFHISPDLQTNVVEKIISSLCDDLATTGLRNSFPSSPHKLQSFELEIQQLVPFEQHLNKYIRSNKRINVLEQWVNKFSWEWVAHRENYYLDELRKGLTSLAVEESEVEPIAQDEPLQSTASQEAGAEEDWNWGDDDEDDEPTAAPVSATASAEKLVTTSAVSLVEKLISNSASELPEQRAHFANAILLAYRALAPLSYRQLPTKLIFLNDVTVLCDRLSGTLSNSSELEALRNASDNLKTLESTTLLAEIQSLLMPAARFEHCRANKVRCRQAVTAVFKLLEEKRNLLKSSMSPEFSRTFVGDIVASLFNTVIEDIKSQRDIAATDCDELAIILDIILANVYQAFDVEEGNGLPAQYLGSIWFKFNYLIEILKSNLVDLEVIYDESSISQDFTAIELQLLVEALYQDSERRTRLINKIRGS